jgi:hypothetical protein
MLYNLTLIVMQVHCMQPIDGPRCTVPSCGGGKGDVKYDVDLEQKEELWDRYYTAAPERRRLFVERYKIVKRA